MTAATGPGLSFAAIADLVGARLPGVARRTADNGQPYLFAEPHDLVPLLRLLRDDPALRFDALMDLTGFDLKGWPAAPGSATDAIAVVYLAWSHTHRHKATVFAHAARADCRLPTASGVWPAALYFEREVFDLLGVHFEGHPSLARILCPADWVGHPLRKDYVYPADYHGVPHLRDGQHFEHVPPRPGQPADARKGQP